VTWDEDSGADDVIEHGSGGRRFELPGWLGYLGRGPRRGDGPGWRPSRGAVVLAAVALLAGLGAGYAAGRGTSGRGAAAAAAAPSATSTSIGPGTVVTTIGPDLPLPGSPLGGVGPAVDQLIDSCSSQSGTRLQLGIELANTSSGAVTLTGVTPVYPGDGGGLRAVSWQWAPCGSSNAGTHHTIVSLGPGSTAWLSVTFKVLVHCPAADPVEFNVKYVTSGGVRVTDALPGFDNLGEVRYSGCGSADPPGSSVPFSAVFFAPVGGAPTAVVGSPATPQAVTSPGRAN
jgi:hypothetical protein